MQLAKVVNIPLCNLNDISSLNTSLPKRHHCITFDMHLQINMAEPVMVTGMFIQGDPETDQWVSSFHVTYSVDCITYYPVFDVGINQVRPTLLIT